MMNEQLRRIALKLVREIIAADKQRLSQEQEIYKQIGNRYGFTSLTTNSSGSRSLQELTHGHQAFYSGLASSCLAAAIVHPEIGMGAAHFNTVTPQDVENYVVENLSGRRTNEQLLELMNDPVALLNAMVSAQSRVATIQRAVDLAAGEFLKLANGTGPMGTTLLLCGGFYVHPHEVGKLIDTATITLNPRMFSDPVRVISRLGTDNGIMFGFPQHRLFRGIGFYNLREFEQVSI